MKLRIAKSRLGDAIHCRRGNHATKRAGDAVALIVRHDKQDVWGALRRHQFCRPAGLGIDGAEIDHTLKTCWRSRHVFTVGSCCGAGGTGRTRRLLCVSSRCGQYKDRRHQAKCEQTRTSLNFFDAHVDAYPFWQPTGEALAERNWVRCAERSLSTEDLLVHCQNCQRNPTWSRLPCQFNRSKKHYPNKLVGLIWPKQRL